MNMTRPGAMLFEVLRSLWRKTATENYPYVKKEKPAAFRGQLEFFPPLCIGCKMCMRDCPADAIIITKTGEKQFQAGIRLDKCIFCGQCVDTCPKKALAMTKDFELAQIHRADLKVVHRAQETGSPHIPAAEEKPIPPSQPPAGPASKTS